ncbi:RAD50-interacting protein 1 [Aricia agestis]|uniref:RAD50-interacting protein 1 n=1 Tax=Aricia agestis TaxID=91739 RepID=UPI001C20BF97|nr:RAD50-interacting protein 1 [Aricia agestis]
MKGLCEKSKKDIIQDVNFRIGNDITNLTSTLDLESELAEQKKYLQSCLHACNDEVPTKLSSAIEKAESNSKYIETLKEKSVLLKIKVDDFIQRTEPIMGELDKRFTAMAKLEEVLAYLKSYARIEELCAQMKQCKDDEQLVVLYGEIKAMCNKYRNGHRGTYIKDYTHYWHDILKENLTKHYEEHLKVIKWPLSTSGAENSPLPKEVMNKFTNLTRHLFLIQEPEDVNATLPTDITQDQNPSLPIRILLRPLKKRFAFHFTGSRQTARIDRPEWFLTQTLTWIKDHQAFVKNNVQPVADKLQMKHIDAVNEFNTGLIALAAERLHTVLAAYHTQGSKGGVDVDAAFAHAVDETLGFHRELITVTENEASNILSVLTKAETFVQWLAVERKYALAKMDDILDNEQWTEPVAAGVGAAVGALLWVPRGADWFVTLLKTIEDRYAALPQPGHRLQFLELQLELVEEWRVRLTQLLGAAAQELSAGGSPPLPAIVNAAHHTRAVLVQWAHSLHYLQLHYYRRQFQHFTQQQHRTEDTPSTVGSVVLEDGREEPEIAETMSLSEVEIQAKRLALNEVTRRSSALPETMQEQNEQNDVWATDRLIAEQILNVDTTAEDDLEDDGAFAEVSGLLAHLRNAGLALLAEHIILEFKATIRDYKKQKWHAMVTVEDSALCVSTALCGPLAALCARTTCAARALAPPLAARLRALLADHVDRHLYEEVVLESWFNTGGTLQLTHDVKRNLVPAFAPPNKNAQKLKILPRLQEACRILNLDYEDARRVCTALARGPLSARAPPGAVPGAELAATITLPATEALRILNQRTDLSENASPSYVMELF